MYRQLLVPMDGSTFAEHALPAALTLARRGGATLHLVTVCPPLTEVYTEGLYIGMADLLTDLMQRQQAYLDGVVRRLKERGNVTVTTTVVQGEVADTLCHLVADRKADLVVMATHGRGALGRFWLGSVADEMIRHGPAALLLVRPQEEVADLSHEPDLGRVLIALDGTPLSEQILEPAVQLAGLMPEARFTLMRAIAAVVPVASTPDVPEGDREARQLLTRVQGMQTKLYEDIERYLGGVA